MSDPLAILARRAESDSFFLASALATYAESESLGERELAQVLGCNVASLPRLCLCRRPRREPAFFREDIGRIASVFEVNEERLAEVVRRADVLEALFRPASESGYLMAARDHDEVHDEQTSNDRSRTD
jgi:hypothetical protein